MYLLVCLCSETKKIFLNNGKMIAPVAEWWCVLHFAKKKIYIYIASIDSFSYRRLTWIIRRNVGDTQRVLKEKQSCLSAENTEVLSVVLL